MAPNKNTWILPDGIEQVLPPDAAQLDHLSRQFIDTFKSWGYQLVMPPMVEYLESLLTGTGEDLEMQTFKITDLISGRMMGIRADTTPQVARIDAHYLRSEFPQRLCYLGTVLHTKPAINGMTRSPLQVGAELFGYEGIDGDVEIMCLMLSLFDTVGLKNIHIDVGHVGIYTAMIEDAGLNDEQQSTLFDILQRKDKPQLAEVMSAWQLDKTKRANFQQLMDLHGGYEVLQQAESALTDSNGSVAACLDQLNNFYQAVKSRRPDAPLNFDLSDLRGYHYHNGVMFTVYAPGEGSGIAFGGRYDNVGAAFGHARPATGFSTDLKQLMKLVGDQTQHHQAIFAPAIADAELHRVIEDLRNKGEVVIEELPGQKATAADLQCNRQLKQQADGRWLVESI